MTRYAKRKLKYSLNENFNLLPYVEWDRFVTLTGAQAEWGLCYRIYISPCFNCKLVGTFMRDLLNLGKLKLRYCFKVALEGNFVCLDYQSLKDYFSKTAEWKLNILVSMCFWKIALYCKLISYFKINLIKSYVI
jgi:hypothetical protein